MLSEHGQAALICCDFSLGVSPHHLHLSLLQCVSGQSLYKLITLEARRMACYCTKISAEARGTALLASGHRVSFQKFELVNGLTTQRILSVKDSVNAEKTFLYLGVWSLGPLAIRQRFLSWELVVRPN